jgi:serine/threonine-protein kinase
MMPEHPRYSLIDTIAKGDFATVFRGHDGELDREVAVKQIHAQYLDDPQQLERYWQEAQLIANLEHPRIMTIYDIVRERGWLVLELMLGSLPQQLRGNPIDLKDLRLVLIAIAKALRFLEQNGIVHGDVKPSNMLLDKNRQPKLGDFGIARRLSGDEGSVVKGTTKYMAPEVVSDQFGDVGPHSDLYSLGFSAFELMCGQNFETLFPGLSMFGRDQQIAWMMWHSAPDRRLPPIARVLEGVPSDLAHAIEKLCEKDPTKRYRSAQEVLDDLREDGPREPSQSVDESTEDQIEAEAEETKARRKRILVISALAISMLLSVGMLFIPPGETKPQKREVAAAEPASGMLVHIDRGTYRLAVQSQDGTTSDLTFSPDADMVLLNGSEADFAQLQKGDQLDIDRLVGVDGTSMRLIRATRATDTDTSGVIASVEATAKVIVVSPNGSSGDELRIFVPSNVQITLALSHDGQEFGTSPISMADLASGDQIDVQHGPGTDDRIAKSVCIRRELDKTAGSVETVVAPSKLTMQTGQPPVSSTLVVAQDCHITINDARTDEDGRKYELADLEKGDQVTVFHHNQVVRIDARRQDALISMIDRIDYRARQVFVKRDGRLVVPISVPTDCEITRQTNGEAIDFLSLRIGDRVTILQDQSDGSARSIQVVFQPDPRAWAIVIAHQQYDDNRLAPLRTTGDDADLVRRALINCHRVPEHQLLSLLDASRRTLEQEVPRFLRRIPDGGQLVVYFAGYAYRSSDGVAYLAPAEFDVGRQKETGLELSWLLAKLDDSAANEKILLFDAYNDGRGPAAAEIVESLKAINGAVARSAYVIASCSKGQQNRTVSDGTHGLFPFCAAEAFRGKADHDKDYQLTLQELFGYLGTEMTRLSPAPGQQQTPGLFEPAPPSRMSPEAKDAMRKLLAYLRQGRHDDNFAFTYHEALALAPRQPDARLIDAVALLKDKLRLKLARERFDEVIVEHPKSVVANHALAWQCFRGKQYQQGIENIRLALSNLPKNASDAPTVAYCNHLFKFAGQLSAFALNAVGAAQVKDVRPLYNLAVQRHGEDATAAYVDGLDRVKREIAELDREMKENPADESILQLKKTNIATYASFEFVVTEAYLAATLDKPYAP